MVCTCPGYEEDVANIQEFFHGTMGYEVRVHKNLNQTELMKTVKQERDKIENSGYFDRLFVVVLSHGSSVSGGTGPSQLMD